MAKIFVVFGATGSQGGVVVSDLLRLGGKYAVRAVTRNPESNKSKKLAEAGLTLVQADMNDLDSLKKAVKGAHFIFAVTDFITAGNVETETMQGLNILEAAKTTLDTLEAYIWSGLPDARTQPIPYQNVVHFNSKNDIAKEIRRSAVGRVLTEVRLGPYYQNFVKAPHVYGPQKQSDGAWVLMLPVNADTRMPFTSVQDLGRLVTVIVEDPAKYRTKTVSVVSQRVTPTEMLKSWNKAVGLKTTFKSLSTDEYKERLMSVHKFPSPMALTLAENLSVYRDDPEAWIEGTDFAVQDVLSDLKTWDEYVKDEDWDAFFKSIN